MLDHLILLPASIVLWPSGHTQKNLRGHCHRLLRCEWEFIISPHRECLIDYWLCPTFQWPGWAGTKMNGLGTEWLNRWWLKPHHLPSPAPVQRRLAVRSHQRLKSIHQYHERWLSWTVPSKRPAASVTKWCYCTCRMIWLQTIQTFVWSVFPINYNQCQQEIRWNPVRRIMDYLGEGSKKCVCVCLKVETPAKRMRLINLIIWGLSSPVKVWLDRTPSGPMTNLFQ